MKDFKVIKRNGVNLYTVSLFEKTGVVKTGFSTRIGGVSEGKFSSLNFSFTTGDDRDKVIENYRRYCNTLDIDANNMVLTKQVHRDGIHIADDKSLGALQSKDYEFIEADAAITIKKDLTLVKFSADCPIIYLLDKKKKAVGLIHSGWRSTEMNIVGKTIAKMEEVYSCNPNDMIAAIGPSIEVCCFEVGEEVAKIFSEGYGESIINREFKKPHIDLKKVLAMQLEEAKIAKSNIAYSDICTGCATDEFHSYRITKGQCGLSIGTITLI